MQQIKKLKRKSLGALFLFIIFFIGIGIAGIAGSNLFYSEPDAQYLYDVPRDQLEGSFVTVNVDWIYGCYAYTETYENNRPTGIITSQEYIIDANAEDYMCLILEGDMMDKADALLAECDAYYYGETDEITQSFTVTGQVKRLPYDSLELYHEALDYDNLPAVDQQIILPLYLSPADTDLEPVPLIFGLVFIGLGLVFLFLALSGHYQKQVKEKLAQLFGENTERADEFLKNLMKTPAVGHLHINNGYLLVNQSLNQKLLDGQDLVWAYKQTIRQRLYGIIPIGKSHRLVLKLANGKEIDVVMREKQIKEQLNKIAQQFPTCAIGYSNQLAQFYQKDPNSMRQVAAAQRQNTP